MSVRPSRKAAISQLVEISYGARPAGSGKGGHLDRPVAREAPPPTASDSGGAPSIAASGPPLHAIDEEGRPHRDRRGPVVPLQRPSRQCQSNCTVVLEAVRRPRADVSLVGRHVLEPP